jgi:hypothetical protein
MLKYFYYNIRHVEKNYEFALKAVKNNHAISEAAGMFTAGVLFPFFKDAKRWRKKGKKYLEELGLKQIYDDGTYMQYSTNYHRLVLEVYSFVLRLGELNNIDFDNRLLKKLNKSVDYLYQIQDSQNGKTPNYGSNDGALLFPLSACDYLNYKPQLNLIYYILNNKKLYKKGKHDESLLWFYDKKIIEENNYGFIKKQSKQFPIGGYYVLRNHNSFAMIRSGNFQDRPSHSDFLHLDLWWKGNNILTDAGSFSYNAEEKYNKYFRNTSTHNIISINNKNQMKKGPRFTWVDWANSSTNYFKINDRYNYFEGEHYGYKSLTHRRAVYNSNNIYIVIDDIYGDISKKISIKQNWLLNDYQLDFDNDIIKILTDQGNFIINNLNQDVNLKTHKGNSEIPAGWKSDYYGKKYAVPQINFNITTKEPYRFITLFYPESIHLKIKKTNNNLINLESDNQSIKLDLNSISASPIVKLS